jgi:hypothetical protein
VNALKQLVGHWDMPKRLKYFVNVQLKVDRVGPIISPLAHPLGGILAL